MPVDGSMTRSGLLTLMLDGRRAAAPPRRSPGRRRDLARHLARRLVEAQRDEDRMAHVALGRPLAKRHLGDELGPDPALAAGAAPRPAAGRDRVDRERRRLRLERDQARVQVARGARVPAGADVAGVGQHALLVRAEEQAADLAARAVAVGEAADHELLAQRALQLEPGLAALRHVGRVGALDDDALELHAARRLEHLRRRRRERLAEADAVARLRSRAARRAARGARAAAPCAGPCRRGTAGRRRSTRSPRSPRCRSRSAAR